MRPRSQKLGWKSFLCELPSPITETTQNSPIKAFTSRRRNRLNSIPRTANGDMANLMWIIFCAGDLWLLHSCWLISTIFQRKRRKKQIVGSPLFHLGNRAEISHHIMMNKDKLRPADWASLLTGLIRRGR